MFNRSRWARAFLVVALPFLATGPALADYTALSYNSTSHWLSGGSQTYVSTYDDPPYCGGYDHVDLVQTFGYDWWMRDVYDGNPDGYMDLCNQTQTTSYGAKVQGALVGPSGTYSSGSDTDMGTLAEVLYGNFADLNGDYVATANHYGVTQYQTCAVEYHYQDWPTPYPVDCYFSSSFDSWAGSSSDDVEVTNL